MGEVGLVSRRLLGGFAAVVMVAGLAACGGSSGGGGGAACNNSAPSELTSGVPVTNLCGAEDSWRSFFIDVPDGASQLQVRTHGGTGDVDIWLYDPDEDLVCEGWEDGNSETCTVVNPDAGRWEVELEGWYAYQGVTLVATVTSALSARTIGIGNEPLSAAEPLHDLAGAANSSITYSLPVVEGLTELSVTLSGGTGNVDLYVYDAAGDLACQSREEDNEESCQLFYPAAGDWTLELRGEAAYEGVSLEVSQQ